MYNIFVALFMMHLREWRNWQTRTFEGRVVYTVRVQVPFLAPRSCCILRQLRKILNNSNFAEHSCKSTVQLNKWVWRNEPLCGEARTLAFLLRAKRSFRRRRFRLRHLGDNFWFRECPALGEIAPSKNGRSNLICGYGGIGRRARFRF